MEKCALGQASEADSEASSARAPASDVPWLRWALGMLKNLRNFVAQFDDELAIFSDCGGLLLLLEPLQSGAGAVGFIGFLALAS
jgi:hypothetical protein